MKESERANWAQLCINKEIQISRLQKENDKLNQLLNQ